MGFSNYLTAFILASIAIGGSWLIHALFKDGYRRKEAAVREYLEAHGYTVKGVHYQSFERNYPERYEVELYDGKQVIARTLILHSSRLFQSKREYRWLEMEEVVSTVKENSVKPPADIKWSA